MTFEELMQQLQNNQLSSDDLQLISEENQIGLMNSNVKNIGMNELDEHLPIAEENKNISDDNWLTLLSQINIDQQYQLTEEANKQVQLLLANNSQNGAQNYHRINLQSAKLEKLSLKQCDLSEADLSFATFVDVDFSESNLTRTSFNHSRFVRCCFEKSQLNGTNFSHAEFENCFFGGKHSSLKNIQAFYATFISCEFSGCKINQLLARDTIFDRCQWTYTIFYKCYFIKAKLLNLDMISSSFIHTYFKGGEYHNNRGFLQDVRHVDFDGQSVQLAELLSLANIQQISPDAMTEVLLRTIENSLGSKDR
jgi:uncharacterized protein YjbI with pentapeptide repeats